MPCHGTFGCNTLSRAFGLLRVSKNQEEERAQAFDLLCAVFAELQKYPGMLIEPEILRNLPINVVIKRFPLNEGMGDSEFFIPLSWEAITVIHRRNLETPEIAEKFSGIQEAADKGFPQYFNADYQPRWLCWRLLWELEGVPRMGTNNNSQTLRTVTEWRSGGFSFAQEFYPYLRQYINPKYPKWMPGDHWTKSRHPHVKVSMHGTYESHPMHPLRPELLTIIAAMCTRLMDDEYKEHSIIPVMMFSFMLPRHGRLFIANFDGHELTVRMSDTIPFASTDEDSWASFIRYLAGDINPIGNTSCLRK
ncbi:hypothetical protein BJX63DRAFT_426875 [Aspergillus granulosus]|uniref:Uncharacterized protein n=1 Tax=Aspergillus granulosus TaxID=176169 RepID=A0ABR4I5M2_9EURO